ncbi:MAG: STAS domain-containing protein [Verrucomicrobiae bacterium]|nr:STAS domain-containing protein [Verrucomicrobiae bacterium]
MEAQYQTDGKVLTVSLKGRLDSFSWEGLLNGLFAQLEKKPEKVVFDLAELEYMCSAGLRIFLLVDRKLRESGGKITICRPQGSVRETLEINQFTVLFPVLDFLEK